jgi:hypothetical protein
MKGEREGKRRKRNVHTLLVNSINNPSQRGSHTIKQNKQTIRVAGKI